VAKVNLPSKVIEALLLLIAVAVVARVVFGLLGPLLPGLGFLVFVAVLFYGVMRRK
jgi:hypothetical protein